MPKREEKPVNWFNNHKNFSTIQNDRSGEDFSPYLYARFGLIRQMPQELIDKKVEYSEIAETYSKLTQKK